MPSFTFVSTANAFVLRGAKVVFVDIRPDTLNIDECKVEAAINSRTKAIVAVHYAGVSCEMDMLREVADRNSIYLIEDAAQAIGSRYIQRPLGTFGHIGCYSFHDTKNITSGGEGGLLILNDVSLAERAEIIREKGTNRSQFTRGEVGKYTWVDLGSSYLPSELQAAYLWAQLQEASYICATRKAIWLRYDEAFRPYKDKWQVLLPEIPAHCEHNAHIYHFRFRDQELRDRFIAHLLQQGITAVFHYVPLHSSVAGKKFGVFHDQDNFTTKASQTLVRLPLFFNMTYDEVSQVVSTIMSFFEEHS